MDKDKDKSVAIAGVFEQFRSRPGRLRSYSLTTDGPKLAPPTQDHSGRSKSADARENRGSLAAYEPEPTLADVYYAYDHDEHLLQLDDLHDISVGHDGMSLQDTLGNDSFSYDASFAASCHHGQFEGYDEEGEDFDENDAEDDDGTFAEFQGRESECSDPSQIQLPSVLPRACLFLANLNSGKSDTELYQSVFDHFETWGPTLNVKVQRDSQGRPFGFVQFKNIADAKRALREAPRTIIDGREVRVEPANVNRTLFISKFNPNIQYKELTQHVERFGPVEELTFLYHPRTKRRRSCAFVKYFSREDAIKALTGIRRTFRYVCDWAHRSEKSDVPKDYMCLFVGKLNSDLVTEELLMKRFGKYGEIVNLKLLRGQPIQDEQRDAFAFIRFNSKDAAEMAMDEENGKVWLNQVIKVKYREMNERRPSSDLGMYGGPAVVPDEGGFMEPISPTGSDYSYVQSPVSINSPDEQDQFNEPRRYAPAPYHGIPYHPNGPPLYYYAFPPPPPGMQWTPVPGQFIDSHRHPMPMTAVFIPPGAHGHHPQSHLQSYTGGPHAGHKPIDPMHMGVRTFYPGPWFQPIHGGIRPDGVSPPATSSNPMGIVPTGPTPPILPAGFAAPRN
ncbi:hypothetical protein HDU97_008698 [Phlyctochytrium planicorne]|nr:hypothetical protein HDU97_008698 [Phlyctochytrium planicorne]